VVDALRGLMVQGGHSLFGVGADFAVQAGAFVVLLTIASRLYPGLVR
jgi:ABC-2 type transport system permease protein